MSVELLKRFKSIYFLIPMLGSIFALVEVAAATVNFAPKVDYATGTAPTSIIASDLDGDTDKDLAVANNSSNTVSVLKNNGDGTFVPKVDYAAGISAVSVFASDLDGDGDQDLAVAHCCSFNNTVSVLKNNGDGTFASKVDYSTGSNPFSVFASDLDKDGDIDLATANHNSFTLSVLKNNGDGTFAPKVDYGTGTFPVSVFASDLDGDGDQDLAVTNGGSSNTISVFKNNGDGTFAPKVDYVAGIGPRSVFASDLDGDGDQDLATANQLSNTVAVFKNNGDGTFATKTDYGAGSAPLAVFASDLDEDGDKDLAVANHDGNTVSVLSNNGDATFAAKIDHGTGINPYSIFASDLDGDGDSDLAVANSGSNTVSVLMNITVQATVVPSESNPATGSQITACLHIDMRGTPTLLGSYGGSLAWDPTVLQFLGFTGGNPPFDTPVVNTSDAASGSLRFGDASASGASGNVFVMCLNFQVVGGAGSSSLLNLELTSAFAANTFVDLLPTVAAIDSAVSVVLECLVGDVNADTRINSGDALIILSDEIGLPIPAAAQERIAARCGDANGDGATDSIDANVVLSFEVGLPISTGFPIGGSNRTFDACPVCAAGGASPVVSGGAAAPAASLQSGVIPRVVVASDRLRRGEEFELTVILDMGSGDLRLGSYGARLHWNPRAVAFLDATGGRTAPFGVPLLNRAGASAGGLGFAHADPGGAGGSVELLRVRFRALHTLPKPDKAFALHFTSLGSPGPRFENLLPLLPATARQ